MVGASVKLLLFQRCLARVQIKHSLAHTHTAASRRTRTDARLARALPLACARSQTKPYGPSFFIHVTVVQLKDEGSRQHLSTGSCDARKKGWNKVMCTGISICSEIIPDPSSLPRSSLCPPTAPKPLTRHQIKATHSVPHQCCRCISFKYGAILFVGFDHVKKGEGFPPPCPNCILERMEQPHGQLPQCLFLSLWMCVCVFCGNMTVDVSSPPSH